MRPCFRLKVVFDGEQSVGPIAEKIAGDECQKFIVQKVVLFNQFVRSLSSKYDAIAIFDSGLWFTRTDWAE
ncbi:hypothetical protein GYB59_02790 [bacterium]|nr:hypothetical protein [bacterium]